jgi:hypothetical protein
MHSVVRRPSGYPGSELVRTTVADGLLVD